MTNDCLVSATCVAKIKQSLALHYLNQNVMITFFWFLYLVFQFANSIIMFKVEFHSYMWRSIGKGVLYKTFDVKVQALLCLNFDVNRFVKYSFSYGTSHMFETSYTYKNQTLLLSVSFRKGNNFLRTFNVKYQDRYKYVESCACKLRYKVFLVIWHQNSIIPP